MNGKRNIKHNESASVRFLMTVICVIAVIMVTVYFIGAQFRPETDTETSGDTDKKTDIIIDENPGGVAVGPPEKLTADTDFTVYISLVFSSSTEPSAGTAGSTDESDEPSPDTQEPESTEVPDDTDEVSPPESEPDETDDYPVIVLCDHHRLREATCTSPAICKLCGVQIEPALGHEYSEATCTEAAACTRCGEVSKKALGHDWRDATCTESKVCRRCGKESGDPLGHKWQDATCTKPETCSRCGETRGEELGHKWREATCTAPETCKNCGKTRGDPAGHKWRDATTSSPSKCSVCGLTKGDRLPDPIKVSAFSYTADDLDMLARLIYLETGTSSRDGMRAVATVVLNRVRSGRFDNTIEGVITAPGQFTTREKLNSIKAPDVCYEVAKECLAGNLYDRDILYFRLASGSTSWGSRTYCFTIGGNYFYT